MGILPWPVVFIDDLLNEFYGYKSVKRLSWITAILSPIVSSSWAFYEIPVEIEGSNLSDDQAYNKVFGQAQMVIVGSICAFGFTIARCLSI